MVLNYQIQFIFLFIVGELTVVVLTNLSVEIILRDTVVGDTVTISSDVMKDSWQVFVLPSWKLQMTPAIMSIM